MSNTYVICFSLIQKLLEIKTKLKNQQNAQSYRINRNGRQ